MAIRLEKGQRINLEKESGTKLTNFCVGYNWGAIIKKTFFGLSTSALPSNSLSPALSLLSLILTCTLAV